MQELKSVSRTLELLNAFSIKCPELSITEAAQKLHMDKVTVSRALFTLERKGFLSQSKETKKYRLGGRILQLAGVFLAKLDLRKIASPYLIDLHKNTNETIHIFIRSGFQRMCIDRIESSEGNRVVLQVGDLFPLSAGAAGKVLMGNMSDDELDEYFSRVTLTKFTQNTIVDKLELIKQIREVRIKGFALSFGEVIFSSISVASPIINNLNEVVAALGITWPNTRNSPEREERFSELIVQAARKLSSEMGYLAYSSNV